MLVAFYLLLGIKLMGSTLNTLYECSLLSMGHPLLGLHLDALLPIQLLLLEETHNSAEVKHD